MNDEPETIKVRDSEGNLVRIFRMEGRGAKLAKVIIYDRDAGIDRRSEFGISH